MLPVLLMVEGAVITCRTCNSTYTFVRVGNTLQAKIIDLKTYGAISFSGETKAGPFWRQILEGRKTQTIREARADGRPHVKVGRPVKLYWRVRMPKAKKIELGLPHLIGVAEVTRYEPIILEEVWDDEQNAVRDGFADLAEFREWFWDAYLEGDVYYVIGWEYPLLKV